MSSFSTYSITLSSYNTKNSKNNELNLPLPLPMELKGKEVALSNCILSYSWRNVTSKFGNNTLQYIFNGVGYSITIPDGFYSVADLDGYLKLRMKENGHYLLDSTGVEVYFITFVTNPVYYAITLSVTPIPSVLPSGYTNPNGITLSGNSPQLVVDNAEFGKLLGFSVDAYPAAPQTTAYQINSNITPNISPVTSCIITCNLVENSRFNVYGDTIKIFTPNVTYGSQIIIDDFNLVWLPISERSYPNITLTFRDQNYRDLELLDNQIIATILIREKQSNLSLDI